jgi:transcriptional regulator with XRE-family HTH domain
MENNQLGNRIRAYRKLKGWTQADFARELGVSLSMVGEWERGHRVISAHDIKRICAVLGVSSSELSGTVKNK